MNIKSFLKVSAGVSLAIGSSLALSGCAAGLSTFNSLDEVVSKVQASGFPCQEPLASTNEIYGYSEVSCHDLNGESYWIRLWPDNKTMVESHLWGNTCKEEHIYGSNWDFHGGTGSESLDLQKFASDLGGTKGTFEQFTSCKQ